MSKELINKVSVTGVLTKNNLEEKIGDRGEYIAGELILRTSDNSEHEINLYSNRYKKDKNGNFTNEESKLYKSYKTIIEEYKDITKDSESPDVIQVSNANFTVNDYKSPVDGEVKTYNRIVSKFTNRVETKDLESTIQEAKFEVEGIIESIKDEVIKNEPTGNKKIVLNTIEFRQDGVGKDAKTAPFALIPVTLIVMKELVEPFMSGGYYEGCVTKLSGKVINTVEIVETIEKQAFGEDLKKTVRNTVRRLEVTSGTTPQTIYDYGLTDEIVQTLISKRKLKLTEVKAGRTADKEASTTTGTTPPPSTTFNPFAAK